VEGILVWMVLSRATGIGRVRLVKLMNAYPDPQDAWRLEVGDLTKIDMWGPRQAASLINIRQSSQALKEAELELKRAQDAGQRVVALPDFDYPFRLRQIPDAPPYFFQLGPWRPDANPVVAIIGTRKPTSYGLAIARRLAFDLAKAGVTIVSGMARGIDCAAHSGALEAGGTSVAVLGGGADVCYPQEASHLYRQMCRDGAIISEQSPGTEPSAHQFPERNRIISGLAHGLIVVEAGDRSGTLITVDAALDQGREVFAVPGLITSPMSVGPHRLIGDGATLITSASDVTRRLGLAENPQESSALPLDLEPEEERILLWMGQEPRWAGDLSDATGLPAGEVQGRLTMLEVRGLARQLPGGKYTRVG